MTAQPQSAEAFPATSDDGFDLEQLSDQPKTAIVKSPNAVEVDGHVVTREKLQRMEDAAKRVKLAAFILDTCGIEAAIGIITGLGDLGGVLLSLYPVIEAVNLGYPKPIINKMLWNLAKDCGYGAIPVVGDIVDFFYKANKKNRKLFEQHLEEVRQKFADHPELITEAQENGLSAKGRAEIGEVLKG